MLSPLDHPALVRASERRLLWRAVTRWGLLAGLVALVSTAAPEIEGAARAASVTSLGLALAALLALLLADRRGEIGRLAREAVPVWGRGKPVTTEPLSREELQRMFVQAPPQPPQAAPAQPSPEVPSSSSPASLEEVTALQHAYAAAWPAGGPLTPDELAGIPLRHPSAVVVMLTETLQETLRDPEAQAGLDALASLLEMDERDEFLRELIDANLSGFEELELLDELEDVLTDTLAAFGPLGHLNASARLDSPESLSYLLAADDASQIRDLVSSLRGDDLRRLTALVRDSATARHTVAALRAAQAAGCTPGTSLEFSELEALGEIAASREQLSFDLTDLHVAGRPAPPRSGLTRARARGAGPLVLAATLAAAALPLLLAPLLLERALEDRGHLTEVAAAPAPGPEHQGVLTDSDFDDAYPDASFLLDTTGSYTVVGPEPRLGDRLRVIPAKPGALIGVAVPTERPPSTLGLVLAALAVLAGVTALLLARRRRRSLRIPPPPPTPLQLQLGDTQCLWSATPSSSLALPTLGSSRSAQGAARSPWLGVVGLALLLVLAGVPLGASSALPETARPTESAELAVPGLADAGFAHGASVSSGPATENDVSVAESRYGATSRHEALVFLDEAGDERAPTDCLLDLTALEEPLPPTAASSYLRYREEILQVPPTAALAGLPPGWIAHLAPEGPERPGDAGSAVGVRLLGSYVVEIECTPESSTTPTTGPDAPQERLRALTGALTDAVLTDLAEVVLDPRVRTESRQF